MLIKEVAWASLLALCRGLLPFSPPYPFTFSIEKYISVDFPF